MTGGKREGRGEEIKRGDGERGENVVGGRKRADREWRGGRKREDTRRGKGGDREEEVGESRHSSVYVIIRSYVLVHRKENCHNNL